MSRKLFTEEQQQLLRNNPYVYSVTASRLQLTKEFKELFMTAYNSGDSPRTILENYGFDVRDMGKDVPPEAIVDETVKIHAPIVGLSALMTTTVPAMEETIKQLRAAAPWCKVVVGGAVLNQSYADSIGADKYAKDAMETVRYAEIINDEIK